MAEDTAPVGPSRQELEGFARAVRTMPEGISLAFREDILPDIVRAIEGIPEKVARAVREGVTAARAAETAPLGSVTPAAPPPQPGSTRPPPQPRKPGWNPVGEDGRDEAHHLADMLGGVVGKVSRKIERLPDLVEKATRFASAIAPDPNKPIPFADQKKNPATPFSKILSAEQEELYSAGRDLARSIGGPIKWMSGLIDRTLAGATLAYNVSEKLVLARSAGGEKKASPMPKSYRLAPPPEEEKVPLARDHKILTPEPEPYRPHSRPTPYPLKSEAGPAAKDHEPAALDFDVRPSPYPLRSEPLPATTLKPFASEVAPKTRVITDDVRRTQYTPADQIPAHDNPAPPPRPFVAPTRELARPLALKTMVMRPPEGQRKTSIAPIEKMPRQGRPIINEKGEFVHGVPDPVVSLPQPARRPPTPAKPQPLAPATPVEPSSVSEEPATLPVPAARARASRKAAQGQTGPPAGFVPLRAEKPHRGTPVRLPKESNPAVAKSPAPRTKTAKSAPASRTAPTPQPVAPALPPPRPTKAGGGAGFAGEGRPGGLLERLIEAVEKLTETLEESRREKGRHNPTVGGTSPQGKSGQPVIEAAKPGPSRDEQIDKNAKESQIAGILNIASKFL